MKYIVNLLLVEFIMNTHVVGATSNTVKLDDDNNTVIPSYTPIYNYKFIHSDL
jgi:hypothetical protein